MKLKLEAKKAIAEITGEQNYIAEEPSKFTIKCVCVCFFLYFHRLS